MKANKFVKKFGLGVVKNIIKNSDEVTSHIRVYDSENLLIDYIQWDGIRISVKQNDKWIKLHRVHQELPKLFITIEYLKRLVESHELVEKVGGLENAKTFDEDSVYCIAHLTDLDSLKKSIADVESCQ